MIIPYNISDFKRNLYHSQNRRDGVAGLRSPASRRDLCPPLPKNVCRAGIIPTGSCAAARRLFQQYPKTLDAPKTGRGGKDPAASPRFHVFRAFSFAAARRHSRAPPRAVSFSRHCSLRACGKRRSSCAPTLSFAAKTPQRTARSYTRHRSLMPPLGRPK